MNALNEEANAELRNKTQLDKVLNELKRNQNQLSLRLRELEGVRIEEPIDMAVFEEEIAKINAEIVTYEQQRQQIETDSGDVKAEFESARAELDQMTNDMKNKMETAEELRRSFDKMELDRTRLTESVKYYKNLYNDSIATESQFDVKIGKERVDLEVGDA
jgi:chromosome segregation ATPase